jgi:hypothetical protein
MLMLVIAFWIEAAVLFDRAFADSLHLLLRVPAALFFGFAVACPLLLTAINSRILPSFKVGRAKVGFPELFGGFTVMMVLLFFDVWGVVDKPRSWYILVSFLAAFLGIIDYLYASLFVTKYNIEASKRDYQSLYESTYDQLSFCQQDLHDLSTTLLESGKHLNEAKAELNEYRQQLTCSCGHQSKTYSAHRNHVSRCEKK